MTSNLMNQFAILRLNKTFGRNSLSTTGVVPTLTDGCTNMVVPADATTLSGKQLLCLTGLHPKKHRRAFRVLPRILSSPQKDFRASTMISLLWVLMFFVIKLRMLGHLGSVCQCVAKDSVQPPKRLQGKHDDIVALGSYVFRDKTSYVRSLGVCLSGCPLPRSMASSQVR